MARNINDFKGEWHVWWVQGFNPILRPAWKINIGTGAEGTELPYVSEHGEVCTGFVVYEVVGDGEWTIYTTSNDDGPLVLADGQLRWFGTNADGHPFRTYMSLAEGVSDKGPFVSMYGSSLLGDPDQVAVWGANDGPPRPDPGPDPGA